MQPEKNEFSAARRPLDVEDYIDVARRHKAWILGPAFFGLVLAVVVAFLWPDTYISEAVIRVVPPVVPEKYVQPNVNMAMDQRINSMALEILSKSSLTNIITTYNLYPAERNRLPMEDVVEDMRNEIKVGNVYNLQRGRNMTAFAISFAYNNRYTAQKVTQDLVGRFIDANIRTRANQSVSTTTFLNDQWEAAKKELDEKERKLSDFKARNQGRLPDQADANLQRLTAVDTQITGVNASINRAQQERLLMESQLESLRKQLAQAAQTAPPPEHSSVQREANQRIAALDRDISALEMNLTALRERYTEAHPDVETVKKRIATLQETRADLVKKEEQRDKDREKEAEKQKQLAANAPRRVDAATMKEIQALQLAADQRVALMRAKDLEIDGLRKELQKLEAQAKDRRALMAANPINEGEYSMLLQDRELARKRYDELNSMLAQSQVATDLENRKQGETLELLDPASLPQTPTAPKRWLIIGVGFALGIMVGVSLAGAREMKDTSLKNLKDVRAYTQLAVLASVPLLENDLVVRRRRRLTWLMWSTACFIGIAVMTASVVYYSSTRS